MTQYRYVISCACGQPMRVSDTQIGRQGTCIRCGRRVDLSRQALESEAQTEPALTAGGSVAEEVAAEWEPGDVILGLYEVKDVLGEGGMGKVYKVHHRGWGMDLAVKSPHPTIVLRRDGVPRFERECSTWIDLGLHPHIVTCYYVRRLSGIPRVFAEYVEGGSLWTWIREKRLYEGGHGPALARMLDVAVQFAWGLQHAHERGFVHQDVKPGNVLVSPGNVAKVCDFGLARALTLDAADEDSCRGMTRVYRSPEQVAGREVTPRTDIWSWGLSILEMFFGRHRWHVGEQALLALKRYGEKGRVAPPEIPRMPRELMALLARCFQDNPDDRPRDMAEIARALQGIYRQYAGADYFRQAPRPADALSDSLNNRAVSLLDLGKREDALRMWRDALHLDPQHPDSTYNVGLLQWRAGEISDEVFLQRMREIGRVHAGDPMAPYRVAQIHLERGDYVAAGELLEKLDRAAPGRPELASAIKTARERRDQSRGALATLTGHNDAVTVTCVGEGAKLGLSGSDDNTVRVWDLETGRMRYTLEGHTNTVRALALSGGGHFALSAGADKLIRMWNPATGHCRDTLDGHEAPVRSLSLSMDGRFLASASEDKTIRLWDLDTRACLRTLRGHAHWVSGVQLSMDARRALSGGYDRTLRLWDTETGECLRTLSGHEAVIECVAWTADGRFALSGDEGGLLKLWLLPSGECLRTMYAHRGAVRSVSVTGDGRFAVSGGMDGRVRLWEVLTGRCLCTFEGHAGPVYGAAVDTDGRVALSGGRDRGVRLWRVNGAGVPSPATVMVCRAVTGEAASTEGEAYAKAMRAAQRALAAGNAMAAAGFLRTARSQPGRRRAPDTMREWRRLYARLPRKEVLGGWEHGALEAEEGSAKGLWLARNGRRALSLGGQNALRLWDLEAGQCLRVFGSEAGPLNAADLSDDGRLAAAGSWDIRLWNTETGRAIRTFERQSDGVHALAISPDGTLIASGGAEWLRLWHVGTGQCLWAVQGHAGDITALTWTRDGCAILSGGEDQALVLWDVAQGEALRVLRGQGGPVRAVSVSDDGRYALSTGRSRWGTAGKLQLWDLVTGRPAQTFEGHAGDAASAQLSADGRHVLSGGEDKTVKLWDVTTGRCVLTLDNHGAALAGVGLTTDCGLAVSVDRDGGLRLWLLDWDLEDRAPADWDNGALPYLRVFLTRHTPYAAALPANRPATETEIRTALQRRGHPAWTAPEMEEFLAELGAAGYGWLRHDSIRERLQKAAGAWTGPPCVYRASFATPKGFAQRLRDLLGR